MSTLVIAGASGFLGSYFRRELTDAGWTVRTIGRSGDATWGDAAAMTAVLEGADLLVNLAGKSVSCRYTPANRTEIFDSRVETTAELGRAITACQVPPRDWFNASTGTIYRDARDRAQTEHDGELGTGFSVEVARGWEAALGGRMGDGTQKYSWIHVTDLLRAVLFIHEQPGIAGPVNIASPNPVTNAELMAEVRRAVRMPFGVPTPAWLLGMGAVLIHTETELVLKSRWVLPQKLADAGFTWRFPSLRGALADIVAGVPVVERVETPRTQS